MDFNTFLLRLGFDPGDFVNKYTEPIETDEGFIYEVEQTVKERRCPYCNGSDVIIHDHDIIEINCAQTDQIKEILRIRKVRLLCKQCHKTFTPDISGIRRHSRICEKTKKMIVNDFFKMMSFSAIAERYHTTTARIVQIFDEVFDFVPRKSLPYAMCIDEKRFTEEIDQKYCCLLYDFDTGDIIDVIKNRQLPYLEEYFSKIKENERERVKYFISDMNDPYKTIKKKYFGKALHVVDLFHVIKLMTSALNSIRVRAMKSLEGNTRYYSFMKRHWKLFLSRKEDIPDKKFSYKDIEYDLGDMVFECILKNELLNSGYNILQDLYKYNQRNYTFTEAYEFIMYIAERLLLAGDEILESVGRSYRKWAPEIANGLAYTQSWRRFTNSMAEGTNNHIETIIRIAYGYHNFERFRKRLMLIRTYRKDLKQLL